MKALLVTADGNVEVVDQDWTYQQISSAVGGLIQPVYFENDYDSTFAYVNEEGKILGMPENVILTNYWYESGVTVLIGDYIAGNAVVFGGIDNDGNNKEITADVAAKIMMQKAKIDIGL